MISFSRTIPPLLFEQELPPASTISRHTIITAVSTKTSVHWHIYVAHVLSRPTDRSRSRVYTKCRQNKALVRNRPCKDMHPSTKLPDSQAELRDALACRYRQPQLHKGHGRLISGRLARLGGLARVRSRARNCTTSLDRDSGKNPGKIWRSTAVDLYV